MAVIAIAIVVIDFRKSQRVRNMRQRHNTMQKNALLLVLPGHREVAVSGLRMLMGLDLTLRRLCLRALVNPNNATITFNPIDA